MSSYIMLPRLGQRIYVAPSIVYPKTELPPCSVGLENLKNELKEKLLTASVDEQESVVRLHTLETNK